MSNEVNVFDLPEEGFNTDLTTVEVEKLGDVNISQNVDAVPAGGTTGQVLAKNSNTDYDTEWVTGGGGGGSGDMTKTVYDTTDNGIVDNSERLGGQLPAYYQPSESGKGLSQENYTTAEKNKLASITEIFITALKNAYDSAVTWIATNGANLLTHLGLTNNPHSVTKAQVGLANVPNLDTSTSANITDSTNKRFVTDANLTLIGNTIGTNTGDNATNSQYSGLAASKQNTLTSGGNIKTLNGSTLLGSGNIDLSRKPRRSGMFYTHNADAITSGATVLNRLYANRFDVGPETQNFDRIGVVSIGVASSFMRLGIYTDLNGVPDALISDFGQVSCATSNNITITISANLTGAVWLAGVGQGVAPSTSRYGATQFAVDTVGSLNPIVTGFSNGYYQDSISGALPSTWGANYGLVNSGNQSPIIMLRKT